MSTTVSREELAEARDASTRCAALMMELGRRIETAWYSVESTHRRAGNSLHAHLDLFAGRVEIALDELRNAEQRLSSALSDRSADLLDEAVAQGNCGEISLGPRRSYNCAHRLVLDLMSDVIGLVRAFTTGWFWSNDPPVSRYHEMEPQAQRLISKLWKLGEDPQWQSITERLRREWSIAIKQLPGGLNWKPSTWFDEQFGIPEGRLRKASARGVVRRRERTPGIRRYEYCVEDAAKLWPEDVLLEQLAT